MMMSPTSPMSPTFGQFPVGTGSLTQERTDHNRTTPPDSNSNNNNNKADPGLPPLSNTTSPVSPTPPLPSAAAALPPVPPSGAPASTAWSTAASTLTTTTEMDTTTTPRIQKRRSFAQSLKHGMLSLTQLLSPSSSAASSRMASPMTVTPPITSSTNNDNFSGTGGGPPHYNILVLGSDSAPLASTLYKMSGLLPEATKIRHYQEISGFFVAYFRSNGSFSCSPTMTPTTPTAPTNVIGGREERRCGIHSSASGASSATVLIEREGGDEVKSRRSSIQDSEDDDLLVAGQTTTVLSQSLVAGPSEESENNEEEVVEEEEDPIMKLISARSSEETLLQLKISAGGDGSSRSRSSMRSRGSGESTAAHSVADLDREEVLLSEDDDVNSGSHNGSEEELLTAEPEAGAETDAEETVLNSSANASLSVHAFSLDTTWPVPRILAQTFWFPHAHGIIYIVDATRKNDPRGIDHLLNARQFLASLVADPHFRRKDIPVVVFANKAGLDPETCYRVDEIAEILGCEDWDLGGNGSGSESERKVKSGGDVAAAAGGGSGGGSVEGGVVGVDGSGVFKTRPWCVKSTRCDGAGDGLRESVEWLKSRMGETWQP
ncbi:hypothetical protein BGX33_010982 [Mortierella sp. NVP41]|nr:hypothetical protein BGX33_010982 [Mortierella sp. NVP41]